jgi:hypothetical protein
MAHEGEPDSPVPVTVVTNRDTTPFFEFTVHLVAMFVWDLSWA